VIDNLYIVKDIYKDEQDKEYYMLLIGIIEYGDEDFSLSISNSLKISCCAEFNPRIGDIIKIQHINEHNLVATFVENTHDIKH